MKAYTLSILTKLTATGRPITEKEIIHWINNKLETAGKSTRVKSFQVGFPFFFLHIFLILMQ